MIFFKEWDRNNPKINVEIQKITYRQNNSSQKQQSQSIILNDLKLHYSATVS